MLSSAPQQLHRLDGRVPTFLMVDLAGDGLCLAPPADGVEIRFGSAAPQRVAWTCAKTDDGFLAMDIDRDGRIEVPLELLGAGIGPEDGWDYLARFDGKRRLEDTARQPDGLIDARDAIYDTLVIWTDGNRDARVQEAELSSLSYAGLDQIELTPTSVGPILKSIAGSQVIRTLRATGKSSRALLYSITFAAL